MPEKIPVDRDRVAFEINRMRKSDDPDVLSSEEEELAEKYIEQKNETDPEKAKELLEKMDADELLFRDALETRKKCWGLGGKLEDFTFSESRLGNFGKAVAKMGGSAIASRLLSNGLRSLGAPAVATGAIVGSIAGGFWGYIKTRKQNEAIGSWEKRLDIDVSEEDLIAMDDEKLEFALGILNQAVKDGKVSGKPIQKIELARKIRIIRNSLEERNAAAAENPEDRSPVLERIEEKIKDAEDDGKAISEMAAEKYEDTYDEITKNDRKKAVWSGVKGALIGAGLGALSNWAMDRFHIFGGGSEHHQANISDLRGQEATIAKTHLENMSSSSGPSFDHLLKLAEHGGNVNGFSGPDLSHFTEMIRHGNSLKELHQFAEIHNIDFGARIGDHGQAIGQFILNHKDQFLNLPADVQREMLSYPSLANEIFNAAMSNSAAANEVLKAAIGGGIGLIAIGGGFLWANRRQKNIDEENSEIIDESKVAAEKEMDEWKTAQENARKEEAEAKAHEKETVEYWKNELAGKVFTTSFKKELADDGSAVYKLPMPGGDEFAVVMEAGVAIPTEGKYNFSVQDVIEKDGKIFLKISKISAEIDGNKFLYRNQISDANIKELDKDLLAADKGGKKVSIKIGDKYWVFDGISTGPGKGAKFKSAETSEEQLITSEEIKQLKPYWFIEQ